MDWVWRVGVATGHARKGAVAAFGLLLVLLLPIAVIAHPIVGESVVSSALPPLTVSKWDLRDPNPATWRLNYVVRLQNNSDSPIANVVVTDTLPPGTYFESASDGGTAATSASTVTWSIASLAPHTVQDLLLTAGTHSWLRGLITNTVCAQPEGGLPVCAEAGTTLVAPPPPATPTSTPTPGPWTCARSGYLGAPHGLPDFDLRQDLLSVPGYLQQARTADSGVTAFANALWFLDAQAEAVLGAEFHLVDSAGPWNEHGAENVPPVLANLAVHLGSGESGVSVEGAVYGLDSYFAAQHTLGAFDIETARRPTVAWLKERARTVEGVALVLLGFYQEPPPGRTSTFPVRTGGHWVAVCCVEREGAYVEFADPWFDAAARGSAGRSWGGVPAEPTVHNDTANVSYDRYTLANGDSGFVPLGYGGFNLADIAAASAGLNFSTELETLRGDLDPLLPVQVVADYAVLIRPAAGYPIYEPSPTPLPSTTPSPTVEPTATPFEQATATPTGTAIEEATPTPTSTSTPDYTATPEAFSLGLPIIAK